MSKKLKPYVWHKESDLLLDVSACKIVYLSPGEAANVRDGGLLPVDANEFELVVGDER